MNGELAVQNILVNDGFYKSIVGTKVFFDEADQGALVPYCIVRSEGTDVNDTQTGVSTLDFDRVSVLHYAATENVAKSMAVYSLAALDRLRGTFNGIVVESINFNDQSTDSLYLVDKPVTVVEQSFQVMTTQ